MCYTSRTVHSRFYITVTNLDISHYFSNMSFRISTTDITDGKIGENAVEVIYTCNSNKWKTEAMVYLGRKVERARGQPRYMFICILIV